MSEELNRKYWELCGWRFHNYYNGGGHWHSPQCAWNDRPKWNIYRDCDKACSNRLPPLHLDANLAIAEADKVFGREWFVGGLSDTVRQYLCAADIAVPFDKSIVASFCEAILKALIAAKEPK